MNKKCHLTFCFFTLYPWEVWLSQCSLLRFIDEKSENVFLHSASLHCILLKSVLCLWSQWCSNCEESEKVFLQSASLHGILTMSGWCLRSQWFYMIFTLEHVFLHSAYFHGNLSKYGLCLWSQWRFKFFTFEYVFYIVLRNMVSLWSLESA